MRTEEHLEESPMERRTFLSAMATSAAGLVCPVSPGNAARDASTKASSQDLAGALAQFRASIPTNFDKTYVENVVVPFFLTSVYEGERPALPMIDVTLSKENAVPFNLWGLIYKEWRPTAEEGVTVFLQGLDERGDNNKRKRLYYAASPPSRGPSPADRSS